MTILDENKESVKARQEERKAQEIPDKPEPPRIERQVQPPQPAQPPQEQEPVRVEQPVIEPPDFTEPSKQSRIEDRFKVPPQVAPTPRPPAREPLQAPISSLLSRDAGVRFVYKEPRRDQEQVQPVRVVKPPETPAEHSARKAQSFTASRPPQPTQIESGATLGRLAQLDSEVLDLKDKVAFLYDDFPEDKRGAGGGLTILGTQGLYKVPLLREYDENGNIVAVGSETWPTLSTGHTLKMTWDYIRAI